MAIGAGAAGAWAATNATTHTVTLPAHATGDMLIIAVACKAATIGSVNASVTTPASGWTVVGGTDTFWVDGATASGNGTGSVYIRAFYKIAASGAETNPIVTWGGSQTAAPGIGVGWCFTKAGGDTWVNPEVAYGSNPGGTSFTTPTNDQVAGWLTTGDWGVVVHATRDDSALTVPTWTGTGLTLGTAVVFPATPITSGTSNDMAGTSAYRDVTAGSLPAATSLSLTGTQVATETGSSGLIRLRVTGGGAPAEDPSAYIGGGYYG